MDKSFYISKQLIENIFGLKIHLLLDDEDYEIFCKNHILHPIQNLFNSKNLIFFSNSLKENTVFYIKDQLQINFIIFKINSDCIIIGPFCSHIFSRSDCIQLLKRLNLSINLHTSLLSYRDKFPILSINEALNIVKSFINVVSNKTYEHKNLDFSVIKDENIKLEENILKKDYSQFIREHYSIEKSFMKSIEAGDTQNAILYLRHQQREFQSFKRLGTTLENERIAAAIVRTMVRIAAINAGLPALSIDLLSRDNTIASRNAKNIDEIYNAKEKMVGDFCKQINNHKNQKYNNLISSIIYYMEHEFDENITVSQLAKEFNITPNYLTNLFHKETGTSPTEYLRQIRTKHACELLVTTNMSIQKISEKVGIIDSNYFVKLFKKDFNLTPSQYRKKYKL